MLLTFIIDPPFLLFLGYLFAMAIPLASYRPCRRTRAFRIGLVVLTIFNVAVAVSFWRYPDWMWMYYLSPSEQSAAIRILIVALGLVAYYALYWLGFMAGVRIRARRGRWAWWGAIALAIASAVIIIPFFARYARVGTTAQFVQGAGIPLPKSPLGPIYNIAIPVMILVGGLGFVFARRER